MKAANQGQVKAQFEVGLIYENGQGVLKNDSNAFDWFSMAAGQ